MWLVRAGVLVALIVAAGGCAVLPVMQSPESLPPGKIEGGIFINLNESMTDATVSNRDGSSRHEVRIDQLAGMARVGVAPGLEAGVRVVGYTGLGLEAKYQFLTDSWLDAALVGGAGFSAAETGLLKRTYRQVQTAWAGLIVGHRPVYAGIRTIPLWYQITEKTYGSASDTHHYAQVVPNLSLGVSTPSPKGRGFFEVNVYRFDRTVVTIGAGVLYALDW